MKKSILVLMTSLLALTMVVACNKKKDEKPAADPTAMGTDMAEMQPEMQPDAMKEDPKPEVKVDPASEAVTPPTLTALAEIGTPKIAVYVDLAKMAQSPLMKETGLTEKMNVSFMKDSDSMDKAALAKCLGIDVKTPTDMISKVAVFTNGSEDDATIILTVPMEAEKLMGCLKTSAKDTKIEDVTFGTAKGYKVTEKEGEVSHFVAVEKNKILTFKGEQKEFVAKLKIGEGNIGKGDVEGYFPGGPQCLKVIVRELSMDEFNKNAKGMIPNLKAIDVDATVGIANGLKVDVKVDTKDAKAAESLAAFAAVMKGNPGAKAQLKAVGLDESLIDKVIIAAKDTNVTVKIDLDMATVKGLVEKLKGMIPGAAAPAAEEPKAEAPKAEEPKAEEPKAEEAKK
ncbi:MAG: hypothetical protein CVU65_16245 [Deltaproteobacteria bacterium HGW-Deltaproteobacteria-22]|jgi:hypothetical protein|nr:MAG: hypothetical protein CVU65_16245 [Deltaproteobacteria bacterium HGW-Deltaproteobacteria-22]